MQCRQESGAFYTAKHQRGGFGHAFDNSRRCQILLQGVSFVLRTLEGVIMNDTFSHPLCTIHFRRTLSNAFDPGRSFAFHPPPGPSDPEPPVASSDIKGGSSLCSTASTPSTWKQDGLFDLHTTIRSRPHRGLGDTGDCQALMNV